MLLSEDTDGPAVTAAFSLHMLKREKGKQRTPSEFEILIRAAGFKNPEFTRITEYSSLITAIKP